MAVKRPICNYGGFYKELASGDTLPGAAFTIQQTEVDFGAIPVASSIFTITDAAATTASRISAWLAYEAPTGKDLDELEMDTLSIIAGNPSVGSFELLISASDGSYLHDRFKINYTIA